MEMTQRTLISLTVSGRLVNKFHTHSDANRISGRLRLCLSTPEYLVLNSHVLANVRQQLM